MITAKNYEDINHFRVVLKGPLSRLILTGINHEKGAKCDVRTIFVYPSQQPDSYKSDVSFTDIARFLATQYDILCGLSPLSCLIELIETGGEIHPLHKEGCEDAMFMTLEHVQLIRHIMERLTPNKEVESTQDVLREYFNIVGPRLLDRTVKRVYVYEYYGYDDEPSLLAIHEFKKTYTGHMSPEILR